MKTKWIRNKGFTLVEVLLTLVIIGVIATLTIPTVIKKITDTALKNQFKKAYSEIYQAIIETKTDLGYMPDCYIDFSDNNHQNECDTFNNAFKNHFKIAQTCDENAYAEGCISNFTGPTDLGLDTNPYYTTSFMQSIDAIRFTDGIWMESISSWSDAGNYVFDTNGNSGPNKWGYDIFWFQIQSDGDKIVLSDWTGFTEPGGHDFQDMQTYAFTKN